MATTRNGRGRKPVDRAPRKSYYVKKADRVAAQQAAQRDFAFGEPGISSPEELKFLQDNGVVSRDAPNYAAHRADQADRLAAFIAGLSDLDEISRTQLLDAFHPGALLDSLARRGGTLKACADAQLLVLKKSADYNNTGANKAAAGTFKASRDDYFPFGLKSYAQMLHTKSQRLISLANKGEGAIFESARDTMLDLINYASFGADWLHRTAEQEAMIHEQGG